MLELSLSRSSPTNTVLVDGRDRPMYSVRTPYRWIGGTTRISRFTNRVGALCHSNAHGTLTGMCIRREAISLIAKMKRAE